MMNARTTVFVAVAGLAAVAGCSRRSSLVVRDGAVEGNTGKDVAGSGGVTVGTGGSVGSGGLVGGGGLVGSGGMVGSGGLVGSGGWVGSGGAVGSGGRVGSGGWVGSGGSLASGGVGGGGAGGGGAGGTTDCLGPSPLGAGVGGGACEGSIRCINVPSATLGHETCNWLVTKGRASVFEAVRACFGQNPDFCSLQPASVEACTGPIFARACAGPGATVDGVKVDCRTLAADCPAVSENECHILTDVLNDKSYQAAFECYFRQSPRPTDCGAALRTCTGAPALGTGGAGGAGGAGGTTPRYDGGAQPACPDLAGTWSVEASCEGPGAFGSGSFVAVMTQTGCKITFTQTDDQTPTQWVSTGSIDSSGKGSLRGDFGFTDSIMCDLEASSDDAWAGRCGSATQACELEAQKQPR